VSYFLSMPPPTGHGFGISGIWIGFTCAVFTASVCMTALLQRTDWGTRSKKAFESGSKRTLG
jgi:Na+-driven multidrug efflux pump